MTYEKLIAEIERQKAIEERQLLHIPADNAVMIAMTQGRHAGLDAVLQILKQSLEDQERGK